MFADVFGLFSMISGLIIGLGAVTVIDLHGFLARQSSYWTEATTRTHKITKPLIWLGISFFLLGSFIYFKESLFSILHLIQLGLALVLILNGVFLTFVISPYLLSQERKGKQKELLPQSMQRRIMVSFLFSFVGWWSEVLLFVYIISR